MKLYQIIAEQTGLRSAEDLKQSFSRGEWENIEFGILRSTIESRVSFNNIDDAFAIRLRTLLRQIRTTVGRDMSNTLIPSRWQSFANRWGIRTGQSNPTWDMIRDKLSEFAETEVDPEFRDRVLGSPTRSATTTRATPERRTDIFREITGPAQFDSIESIRDYMFNFLSTVETIGTRSAEDSAGYSWGDYVQTNISSPTRIQALWNSILAKHLTNNGTPTDPQWTLENPVSKATLDDDLWGFLLVVDRHISRQRREQGAILDTSTE